MAAEMAANEKETLACAASGVTRGVDAMAASQRTAVLSRVVGEAGFGDMARGAVLLAASDDPDATSAFAGALSADDLEEGMELAAIAGRLEVAGEVVATLDMPVLAEFLEDRALWLRRVSKSWPLPTPWARRARC
jgi:hypothetical protein